MKILLLLIIFLKFYKKDIGIIENLEVEGTDHIQKEESKDTIASNTYEFPSNSLTGYFWGINGKYGINILYRSSQ